MFRYIRDVHFPARPRWEIMRVHHLNKYYVLTSENCTMEGVLPFICNLFKNSRTEQANVVPPSGIENR